MSFDISLLDVVTKEVLNLPFKHMMTGGTYRAEYDENTKTFAPMPISEASLNVTYNYGSYYREAVDGGIRALDGKTGLESIEMLQDMISKIEQKYHANGIWISTERFKRILYIPELNKASTFDNFLGTRSWDDIPMENASEYMVDYWVNEGSSNDYWESTAANALKPLHQLLTMAKLRPDGIWEVC